MAIIKETLTMKNQFDYSDAFFAMGTVNTISADLEYREAVRKARKEVLSLHKRFNVFEGSGFIIYRIKISLHF